MSTAANNALVMRLILQKGLPYISKHLRLAVVIWHPETLDGEPLVLLDTNSDDGGNTARALKQALKVAANGNPTRTPL